MIKTFCKAMLQFEKQFEQSAVCNWLKHFILT